MVPPALDKQTIPVLAEMTDVQYFMSTESKSYVKIMSIMKKKNYATTMINVRWRKTTMSALRRLQWSFTQMDFLPPGNSYLPHGWHVLCCDAGEAVVLQYIFY